MREPKSSASKTEISSQLQGKRGQTFWRSLEQLAGTEKFRTFLADEFPALASRGTPLNRRALLKIMGASLALAGLSACSSEADEDAYPYVETPDGVTIGLARWYATAVTLGGYAHAVLGKTYAGRPVKLEGNPEHPVSQGTSDAFTQAALLGLYDPGRSQAVRHLGRIAEWGEFDRVLAAQAAELDKNHGDGFRLLTGPLTSPTLLRQVRVMTERWPKARWHVLETVGEDALLSATARVFGQPLVPVPALDAAEIVVALDDDFLGPGPNQTRNGRLFGIRRRLRQAGKGEFRLMVAEPTPSITGAVADDRLPVSTVQIDALLRHIASQIGLDGLAAENLPPKADAWVKEAAAALVAAKGKSLLLVGAQHAADTQTLGLLINDHLGNLGTTLRFITPPVTPPPDGSVSLKALVDDMNDHKVASLAILGVDPVYASPGDLGFRAALANVPFRIHAGLYVDETAEQCHWHAPLQHDLESWRDARAIDGTVSILQPLVRPFYDTRAIEVILENLLGHQVENRATVQQSWSAVWGDDFDRRWQQALYQGFVENTAFPLLNPTIANRTIAPPLVATSGLTLVIRPDAGVWDGTLSENAWAQETPRPLTKITWGNVILISPRLATARKLENGDEIALTAGGVTVRAPVWIMPGQEENTLTATLGYGRNAQDSIAAGLGYSAYALRRSDQPWQIDGVSLIATGECQTIASTQLHQVMDGFDFVRSIELDDLAKPTANKEADPPSFFPGSQKSDPSWGMAIDLDLCIGCNACVTACQSENNIAVVGKEQVANGREMHWLRIDHYFEGDPDDPQNHFEPVPCMHCQQAPCEMGCPVNATVHSIDGLNLQVYNRCIGTRTCSSFCPYKVRRFNWLDYTGGDAEPIKAMRNPEVTVRARGVMEKCTYCVQRIEAARITADKEGRSIRDGEIVTACQQACPSQAITFGNVADPESAVSRLKAGIRDYSLLEEANTQPRTTYLKKIADQRLKEPRG